MLVVIRHPLTRKPAVPNRLYGMRIVVAQNPFAVGLMQRQRVPHAMGNISRCQYPSH
ncbi:MAG: hypothetical protein EoVTN8_1222 [Fluviibacter phosphoraccumulans EoVTN8]